MPFLMSSHPQAAVCEPLPFLRVPAGYVGGGGRGRGAVCSHDPVLLPEWCPGTRPPPLCWLEFVEMPHHALSPASSGVWVGSLVAVFMGLF